MLKVADYDRPNVHVALDAYLSEPGRSAELLGFATTFSHTEPSLAQLVARGRAGSSLEVGRVGRTMIELEDGRSLAGVTTGLFLVADGERRLAVLVAASPAFLRELVRKAALYAAMSGHPRIGGSHFAEALRELEEGGRLTRTILGAGDDGAPVSPTARWLPAATERRCFPVSEPMPQPRRAPPRAGA